jgi:hypothetical protein
MTKFEGFLHNKPLKGLKDHSLIKFFLKLIFSLCLKKIDYALFYRQENHLIHFYTSMF